MTAKSTNPSDDYLLALDIGTDFVKVLLAHTGKKLEIVGAAKVRQEPSSMSAGAISDISQVVKVCEEAISEAEKMTDDVVAQQVVVGIAGELVIGTTRTIKYKRADSRKALDAEEMTKIVRKVEQVAGEKARQEVAEQTNNPDAQVRLINSAIVNLYIDGYKVTNPIGFKGSSVAIQIYTAFAPLVHISAIEKVAEQLSLDLVAISVEPFALTRACMGDDLDSSLTAILIDVGGGTTDIAVVDDGGVQGTKTFDLGGRTFTRQIGNALGIDPEAAERLKLFQDDPRMETDLKTKLEAAIARTISVWITGVGLALEEFNSIESLPQKILLAGGGSSLIQIPEALATGDWYQDLAFAARPVVSLIDPDDLSGFTNTTPVTLDHSFATALGLLRVGLDTIVPSTTGNSLRAKLARLLSN